MSKNTLVETRTSTSAAVKVSVALLGVGLIAAGIAGGVAFKKQRVRPPASSPAIVTEVKESEDTNQKSSLATLVPGTLRVSLNTSSPSGAAMPGMQEVLRFDVKVLTGNVTLLEVPFAFSSADNAGTDWNDCGNSVGAPLFANPSNFQLYDKNMSPVNVSWNFLTTGLSACSFGSSYVVEPVGYAVAQINFPILTGGDETFHLYVNTVGASAVNDDSIATSVSPDTMFIWNNGFTNQNGVGVLSLPIQGGTLQF